MKTTLLQIITNINEELKIDWAGGDGFSREFIIDTINSAMQNLSEWTTIRDEATITTTTDTNEYSLSTEIDDMIIEHINSVKYDGNKLTYIQPREYEAKSVVDEGEPSEWTLWGDNLIIIGEVEDAKTISLKVIRSPAKLEDDDDELETPKFADEAIKYFVMAACYRQSKDYERSNYYDYKFTNAKRDIVNRSTPQVQQEALPVMSDDYWPAERNNVYNLRSDTNPGGD
jgi:hypothetical protein